MTRPLKRSLSLAAILIREGFVPNEFLLVNNHTLSPPWDAPDPGDPWNLPSRLMQFPLEVQPDKNGDWQIGLMHPLLARHPFVRRVAKAIRPVKIAKHGAPNDCGYTKAPGTWWHAVDLIAKGLVDDLLRTRRFTSDADLVRGVIYGLDYRYLDLKQARTILVEARAEPPPDPVATLALLCEPVLNTPEKGAPSYPINATGEAHRERQTDLAWGRLWGIERGWFAYRKKYLVWTDHGRALRAPKTAAARRGQLALPL